MRLPAARCLVVAVLVIPTGLEPAAGQTPGTFARLAKRDVVPSRTLLAPSIVPPDELLDTDAAPVGPPPTSALDSLSHDTCWTTGAHVRRRSEHWSNS
jgi:hypothetical protein